GSVAPPQSTGDCELRLVSAGGADRMQRYHTRADEEVRAPSARSWILELHGTVIEEPVEVGARLAAVLLQLVAREREVPAQRDVPVQIDPRRRTEAVSGLLEVSRPCVVQVGQRVEAATPDGKRDPSLMRLAALGRDE